MDTKKIKHTLLPGTKVKGTNLEYTVDHVLGEGSFGITYLATTNVTIHGELGDLDTFVHVTLKEFFMEGKMEREGERVVRDENDESLNSSARCFYMEADKLAQLSHPNIVKVLEVFVANNTCYYTMEYLPGGSLNDYISKKKNGLSEAEALKYTRQIGSALSYMHERKMVHLDVKPMNMVFDKNHKLMLIDYGLSIQYDKKGEPEASDGFGAGTPGYAPLEQSSMDKANVFCPTMDVYALGASYYKMLTGLIPPMAVEIVNSGIKTLPLVQKNVSQQSIDAIKAAMEPNPEKRLQTVDDFLAMLPDIELEDNEKTKNNSGNSKILRYINFAVAILVVALVITLIIILL